MAINQGAVLQLGSTDMLQENTSILQMSSWDTGGMESSAHGHTDSFQQRQASNPDPEIQVHNQTKKLLSPVEQPGQREYQEHTHMKSEKNHTKKNS